MLRGICKLPSLKDISPLIRSEQQTCFIFPEIKDKKRWTCSNEPSLTTAILNTLFWRTPVSGTISLRNTIFVFNDSKNILFLCSCLSWNQLPVWIKKELFFSMNKIEEKMGIWHSGVLKARARAFVWVYLP